LPNRAVDEACLDQPARPVNSPRTLSEGSRRIPQPLQRTDKAIPLTKTSLLSCCASQKTQKPPGYCADCPQRSPNAAKHTRLLDQQGSNDRPPTRPDTPDQASTAQAQTIHCPEKQTNALASEGADIIDSVELASPSYQPGSKAVAPWGLPLNLYGCWLCGLKEGRTRPLR
jgi:hypothetical protein